jgi:hypothetical protein
MKKQKLLPFLVLCFLTGVLEQGCSTARTKYSDKNMRVMVDPEGMDYQNQLALQTELVKTDKFTVVDRNEGFKAIKQEQLSAFRTEADRYADREKFAHWGELYGVGSVIVANVGCGEKTHWWNNQTVYMECHQYINMVDTNTGEVIVAVDNVVSLDRSDALPWSDIVEKLVDNYPRNFEEHKLHKRLIEYKDQTEKMSQEQRHLQNPPQPMQQSAPQAEQDPQPAAIAQGPSQRTDSGFLQWPPSPKGQQ